jgi:hypothetical protein
MKSLLSYLIKEDISDYAKSDIIKKILNVTGFDKDMYSKECDGEKLCGILNTWIKKTSATDIKIYAEYDVKQQMELSGTDNEIINMINFSDSIVSALEKSFNKDIEPDEVTHYFYLDNEIIKFDNDTWTLWFKIDR